MDKLTAFATRYAILIIALFLYLLCVSLLTLSAVYEKHDTNLAIFTATLGGVGLLVIYKFWRLTRQFTK